MIATKSKPRIVAVVVNTATKTEARVEVTALAPLSSLDGKALALHQAMTEEEFMDLALAEYRADFGRGYQDAAEGKEEPATETFGYRMGHTSACHFGRTPLPVIWEDVEEETQCTNKILT